MFRWVFADRERIAASSETSEEDETGVHEAGIQAGSPLCQVPRSAALGFPGRPHHPLVPERRRLRVQRPDPVPQLPRQQERRRGVEDPARDQDPQPAGNGRSEPGRVLVVPRCRVAFLQTQEPRDLTKIKQWTPEEEHDL